MQSAGSRAVEKLTRRQYQLILAILCGVALLLLILRFGRLVAESPAQLRGQAEAATRAGNWTAALRYRRHGQCHQGRGESYLYRGGAGLPVRSVWLRSANRSCARQLALIRVILIRGASSSKSYESKIERSRPCT